jgi:hypothetical protein
MNRKCQGRGRRTASIRSGAALLFTMALVSCNFTQDYKLADRRDILSGGRLYADVETYAEFGNHRAGGEGDRATTDWISKKMAQVGYHILWDTISFTRFDLESARLDVGGESLECLPFWFPTVTEQRITAPLVVFDPDGTEALSGKIGVITGPANQWRFDPTDWTIAAASRGALALAIVMPHPSGHVAAQNAVAPFNQIPRSIPVMNVAEKDEARLLEGAQAGSNATLEIRGTTDTDGRTENIIATLERGPEWIVISTPLTGWYTCGGERGPGVALFLGLARWLAKEDLPYSLMFLGNAGHELDQIGATDTLDKNAPDPKDVKAWIHLGASIATRDMEVGADGKETLLDRANTYGSLVSTEALLPAVTSAFVGVDFLTPRSTAPINGELKKYMDAGYPAFGLFGACPRFHTPYDAADSTSPELLEQVADALQAFFDTQLTEF